MSLDQCAQNPDGSLKDANEIQWFYDKDDAEPLGPIPSTVAPAQSLGCGLCNKATNWFLDAVACEQLDSDDENLDTFVKPPKRKHAAHVSNISGGGAPSTLPSRNPFETLLVEETSDGEDDGSFQSDSGSKSSGDNSTDLESISNNEVRVKLFSHNLES